MFTWQQQFKVHTAIVYCMVTVSIIRRRWCKNTLPLLSSMHPHNIKRLMIDERCCLKIKLLHFSSLNARLPVNQWIHKQYWQLVRHANFCYELSWNMRSQLRIKNKYVEMEHCIYDKNGIINLNFIMRMFLEQFYSFFVDKVRLGQLKMCWFFPLSFKYLLIRLFFHGFCEY